MSVIWLAPLAFAGLTLLAAPILIHLLARQQRRPVPFPSLRFLHATRFSALQRRIVDDWPLLLLRLAIVACAVMALAGPLVLTGSRQRDWALRTSRALIVTPSAPGLDDEQRSAFASASFPLSTHAADTLAAAASWLHQQPPSAREIVIAGDLRASMLTDADVQLVPAEVGVRFLPSADAEPERDLVVPLLTKSGRVVVTGGLRVHLDDSQTRVLADSPTSSQRRADVLTVRAAPGDQATADAALHAVLAGDVVLDQAVRRKVVVAWEGADVSDLGSATTPPTLEWIPAALERLARTAEQHGDTLVVRLPSRPQDERAAVELRDVARSVFADSRRDFEPRRLTPANLARWARPPAGPAADQRPQDEGDRRWLWGLTLVLLFAEQFWRRGDRRREDVDTASQEARVA